MSSIVLLQQVLFKVNDVPIFIAGGIATGRMIAHLLLMGADGVQMATVFVATKECKAYDEFKKAFLRARARDAMATPQFDSSLPVVSVRALKNEGTKQFQKLQYELLKKLENHEMTQKEAQMKVEEFWIGALRRATLDGDRKKGSLMAGQSVGLVNEMTTVETLIEKFVMEAEKELERIKEIISYKEEDGKNIR